MLITAAGGTGRFAGRTRLGCHAEMPRRGRGRRRASLAAVVAAVLAAVGVPAVSQSGALASSASVATWTKHAPAIHPPARAQAMMAYDAATGNVVLFGGGNNRGGLSDTWTWNGSTWTKQNPAAHPPRPVRGVDG